MAGEVALLWEVGREFMPPTDMGQVAYVLVEASPTEVVAQVRMPLNFALVLDHSGSMRGKKLASVKEAVKMVIDHLSPADYISLVMFSDRAETIIPAQLARDPQGMKAAVERIKVGGGTNMVRGMRAGLDELRRQLVPYAINRMILLTDGRTIGAKKCLELAREGREAGVVINPLGIGSDWDEELLDDIGELSGGAKAEFIRTPADAMSVFQQQLQSAIDVAVRNAVLTLRLPMGVSPRRATRVLPTINEFDASVLSDRQIVLPLGDLEKNNPQAVLIELMIDPRPPGLFRVAQAELTYDVPTLRLAGEKVREDIKITFRSDALAAGQLNAKVMNFVEKANAHRLVSQVLDEYKRTGKATTRLAPTVTRVLDAETQAALEQIERGRQISAEQVKVISNKTRKLTQRLDL